MYRVDEEIKGDDACKPVIVLPLHVVRPIDITIIIMTIFYYIACNNQELK